MAKTRIDKKVDKIVEDRRKAKVRKTAQARLNKLVAQEKADLAKGAKHRRKERILTVKRIQDRAVIRKQTGKPIRKRKRT